EITFIYKKLEEIEPKDPVLYGTVKVLYMLEDGTLIDSKEVTDLPYGTHTEFAVYYDHLGYELIDEESKSVEITKDDLEHEITFLYKKKQEEPSNPVDDEEPEDEEPKDEEPKDEEPKDEEPVDEEPKDEEPKENEPTDDKEPEKEPKDNTDVVTPKPAQTGDGSVKADTQKGLLGLFTLALSSLGIHLNKRRKEKEGGVE